jgi:hypothetical protein
MEEESMTEVNMRNYRVSGFLVVAIVTAVLLLVPTVYSGMLIFSDRVSSMETVTHNIQPLDMLPEGEEVLVLNSSAPDFPADLLPEIFYISAGTKIPRADFGFAIYINQKYSDFVKPKLLALGITNGIHNGGMIFKTSNNLTIVSPLGMFSRDLIGWQSCDYSNLMKFMKRWQEDNGLIAGDTKGFEFIHFDPATDIFSWEHMGSKFEASSQRLEHTPSLDPLATITHKPIIPTLPPVLFLAIAALLLIIASILLWKIGSFDMSIALFATIPALVLIGGLSIFFTPYIPSSIIPLASFLCGGLLWTIPIFFIWGSLELDKAVGFFWVTLVILYLVTIANFLFPFVWLGMICLLTITVIILAVMVPVGKRDIRL